MNTKDLTAQISNITRAYNHKKDYVDCAWRSVNMVANGYSLLIKYKGKGLKTVRETVISLVDLNVYGGLKWSSVVYYKTSNKIIYVWVK